MCNLCVGDAPITCASDGLRGCPPKQELGAVPGVDAGSQCGGEDPHSRLRSATLEEFRMLLCEMVEGFVAPQRDGGLIRFLVKFRFVLFSIQNVALFIWCGLLCRLLHI